MASARDPMQDEIDAELAAMEAGEAPAPTKVKAAATKVKMPAAPVHVPDLPLAPTHVPKTTRTARVPVVSDT